MLDIMLLSGVLILILVIFNVTPKNRIENKENSLFEEPLHKSESIELPNNENVVYDVNTDKSFTNQKQHTCEKEINNQSVNNNDFHKQKDKNKNCAENKAEQHKEPKQKNKVNFNYINYINDDDNSIPVCSHCGMIFPPNYHNCLYDNYNGKEFADHRNIAELMYQGYIDNEFDDYISEDEYFYINNDYYQYDDEQYEDSELNSSFGFNIKDINYLDDDEDF